LWNPKYNLPARHHHNLAFRPMPEKHVSDEKKLKHCSMHD